MNRSWSLVLATALLVAAAAAAAGTPLRAFVGNDDPTAGSVGHPRLRFVNLAPDAGPVDVLVDRLAVFTNVTHGHPSAHAELRLPPPEAKVIAFGSGIDGTTNDPTTITATIVSALTVAVALDRTWAPEVDVLL